MMSPRQKKLIAMLPLYAVVTAAVTLHAAVAYGVPQQSSPSSSSSASTATETRVPVVFSGGYDTDYRDRGRPVALIAGALGVPPQVFRDAFSRVRPAPAGMHPDPEQVRQNKAVLLGALSPYGVTNERLDAVSNYYRYVRSRGEMWPTRQASAYAIVKDGVIVRYVITDPGSGYSSAPTVIVPVITGARATVQLSFSKQLARNGSIASITVATTGAND